MGVGGGVWAPTLVEAQYGGGVIRPLSRCLAGGVIYPLSRCLAGGVIYPLSRCLAGEVRPLCLAGCAVPDPSYTTALQIGT